jgi:hypothetical protein
MTKKELIDAIKDLPDDMEIWSLGDDEGNSFRRITQVDYDAIAIVNDCGEIEMYSTYWTADEADMDEDEWEELLKEPRVIVLW